MENDLRARMEEQIEKAIEACDGLIQSHEDHGEPWPASVLDVMEVLNRRGTIYQEGKWQLARDIVTAIRPLIYADTSPQQEPWREKFFWADCTLDGLCGVVKECREIIQNTPDLSDSALNQLLELVLSKLNSGLLEVDREYTNADSPKGSGG